MIDEIHQDDDMKKLAYMNTAYKIRLIMKDFVTNKPTSAQSPSTELRESRWSEGVL